MVLGYHLEDASIVGTDIYQANQTLARVGAGGGLGGGVEAQERTFPSIGSPRRAVPGLPGICHRLAWRTRNSMGTRCGGST